MSDYGRFRLADVASDVFIDKRLEQTMTQALERKTENFQLLVKARRNEVSASEGNLKDSRSSGSSLAVSQNVRLPNQVVRFFGCGSCDWKEKGLCPYGFKSGKGFPLKDNSLPEGICRERTEWLASFYRGKGESSSSDFVPGEVLDRTSEGSVQVDSKHVPVLTPTFTEFVMDFNQGLAQVKMMDDFGKLKAVEEKLGSAEGELLSLKMTLLKEEQDSKKLADVAGDEKIAISHGDSTIDYSLAFNEDSSIKLYGKTADRRVLEYQALRRLRDQYRNEWLMLWRELMIADQRRLDRDAPKKVDITHRSITPSDVGRLVREAKATIIDVDLKKEKGDDDGLWRKKEEVVGGSDN